MSRLLALVAAVAIAVGVPVAAASRPADFCTRHPAHPSCVPAPSSNPTPTPTPAPSSTTSPSSAPTSTPSGGTPAPLPSCTGYPEPRVFAEAQAWWTTRGHLHQGACIPAGQVVHGTVRLDVRYILHDNPGKFDYMNPVLNDDRSGEVSLPHDLTLHGWTCSGTCERWLTVFVDTTGFAYDGLQEIRLRSYVVEPDKLVMHASLNVMLDVRNGKAVNPLDRRPYPRAKGWYSNAGYCESNVFDLPVAPVADWRPTVQALNHGTTEDWPVAHAAAVLDGDNHAGIPGTTLVSVAGQLQPTVLNIGAAPGPHRLAVKADCTDGSGFTNSGVFVVGFTVP